MFGHFVSHTVNGFDVVARAALRDLFSQVLDVTVHEVEIVCQVHVIAPKVFGDGGFGQNPVLIGNKVQEQIILFLGKLNRRSVYLDDVGSGVDLQVAKNDGPVSLEHPPSQERFYPSIEFRQMERFGEIVVGAEVQPAHLIVERIFRR